MAIQAFISCRFPVDDAVKHICTLLQPDISPYVSRDVKFGSLPHKLRERIVAADCLIAILSEQGSSALIQNELGIAFALHKPIFAVYEENVDVSGIQPYLSTFIKYKKDSLVNIAEDLVSLKTAILTELAAREIVGSQDELLDSLSKNGVQGIYPDRSTAFRVFSKVWERERDIKIVGSTIEGFKRAIGIDARDFLVSKLETTQNSSIKIVLTHGSFVKYREVQESEIDGYILLQVKATKEMLDQVRETTKSGDRLQWRFFKGAPTCFMIIAGSFMLLNPYLYMQPAYFNFSMIVKDTNSPFDIYNHYRQYHFQRAWENTNLSVDDAGL
jgi:hypothetical protein